MAPGTFEDGGQRGPRRAERTAAPLPLATVEGADLAQPEKPGPAQQKESGGQLARGRGERNGRKLVEGKPHEVDIAGLQRLGKRRQLLRRQVKGGGE